MTRVLGSALATTVLLTAGCGPGGVLDTRSVDEVADEARGHIDDLAAAVGSDVEVRQDDIVDCGLPGEGASGQDLIYIVGIRTEQGVLDRVRGEIAERYREEGWEVRERFEDDTLFRRDNVGMSVLVSPDETVATVRGSGGCVG